MSDNENKRDERLDVDNQLGLDDLDSVAVGEPIRKTRGRSKKIGWRMTKEESDEFRRIARERALRPDSWLDE